MTADGMMGYVEDVLAGRVTACRWVRLACERHLRDLELGRDRGMWWDETAAEHAWAFFGFLRHSKGEWAGRPIQLEPWQQFYIGTLFGWKRVGGRRRFRTSYLEVARKNGKSTMGAGVGLYLLVADSEPGAEVYSAATKRDQARIVHQEAVRMVKQSPALSKRLHLFKDNIHSESTFSKYEPLGRDADSMDGLNVHGAIIDELHAHPTGDVWDVLETATGARRQPLMMAVTTAGYDRNTICFQFHDYTEKVLAGVVEDDAWHGMIYTLDRDDGGGEIESWEDEAVWTKANPNLGVTKTLEDMREKAARAREIPARLNAFQQRELNVWTQASTRWIAPEAWRACNLGAIDEAALQNRVCWGGLDLSSTLDLTALVWVFPLADRVDVLCRLWLPQENLRERVRHDRAPYDAWVRQGLLRLTPGNVVDYEFILAQIRDDLRAFQVRELAFDPWNATSVSTKLVEEDAPLVEFRQGFVSMNPAMKALEVGVQRRSLNHGGNVALAWMADNLVAAQDPAGNLKPDKGHSTEKIDGMVALLMAYYRATLQATSTESVYAHRGILTL